MCSAKSHDSCDCASDHTLRRACDHSRFLILEGVIRNRPEQIDRYGHGENNPTLGQRFALLHWRKNLKG